MILWLTGNPQTASKKSQSGTYCISMPVCLKPSLTAPCGPLYLTALWLICPIKIRAGLLEDRELRDVIITVLSIRVSRLKNLFSNLIL
jgi:hypothetical protein